MIIVTFVVGLAATLSVGHLVVYFFTKYLDWLTGTDKDEPPNVDQSAIPHVGRIPPAFMGLFERSLAFSLFFLGVENAGALLAAWIGAKLATNWSRATKPDDANMDRFVRTRSQIALLAGVVSVTIGAVGAKLVVHHEALRQWIVGLTC